MTKENCQETDLHERRIEQVKEEMPSVEIIERTCNTFRMLGEPSRLKIVMALAKGEMCVYHLVKCCGGTQSGTSHQLRILKQMDLIKFRRDGKNILYSLADDHVRTILEMGLEHVME